MGKKSREKQSRKKTGTLTARAQAPSGMDSSQAWYLAECHRGERLLLGGQVGRASEVFEAILARLDAGPSYARAVILERLGRCFLLGGRPDLALAQLREALEITGTLAPGDGVRGLYGTLQADLGDVLRATGAYGEARRAYEAALTVAEELRDLRGQGVDLGQLGALALVEGRLEEAQARYRAALGLFRQLRESDLEAVARHQLGRVCQWLNKPADTEALDPAAAAEKSDGLPADFEVTIHEDLMAEYVFEPNLLLDGRREQRIVRWAGESEPLAGDVRPMLMPGARSWMDDEGAVRFCLPPEEPILERHPGCIVMRRTRCEVAVAKHTDVLWRLLRQLDGTRVVAELLGGFAADERAVAAHLLAALAATGTLDVSGRPIGRFLHSITKKGVLPGGGLEGEQVLHLATDGNYRAYPEARRIAVGRSTPQRLRSFHALTRARRSRRDYPGLAVSRDEFDALLHTACGVTGVLSQAGREAPLRAYPSSGALYAVEIYPVVFRVAGLEPAVYHYRAVKNELEVVKPDLDPTRLLAAVLPVEREMVAGAAAMICLSGFFPRHERKYGEGGYRMLVAEAGHLSQNLILAATALGLSARPFGGVFDELLNRDLGLDSAQEQFLLAVLVGHAGGQTFR